MHINIKKLLITGIFLCTFCFIYILPVNSQGVIIQNLEDIISKDIKTYPINKFIEDCLNSTNHLKLKINSLLRVEKDKTKKNQLNIISNNLGLILSQIDILKGLISVKPTIPFKLPEKEKPPYTIDVFQKYIDLLREINFSFSEKIRLNNVVKDKIYAIEKDCKNLIDLYFEKKNNFDDSQKYNRLTSILSLKIQYMILYQRQKNYQFIINKLKEQKTELTNRINYIFKNLTIRDHDIKDIKQQKDALTDQFNAQKNKLLEQQREIDKKIIYYEIKLQSIQNKIFSEGSSQNKKFLNIEKERIKSIIKYYNFKKLYLSQGVLSTELKKMYYDFYYLWLTGYQKIRNGSGDENIFKSINRISHYIEQKFKLIIENLADIRKVKIDLEQTIAFNSQNIKNIKDKKLRKTIYNLVYELNRQNKTIDDIIFVLIKNKDQCNELMDDISLISSLLKDMLGWIKGLNVWTKEKFLDIYGKFKYVVLYPFAKIGNLTLSIASIFKILISFLLGLLFLRWCRKKVSYFLQHNTKLSLGAIHSITTLGYYFSMVLLVLIVLSTAGIDLTQLSILMGALGVGIGFGLQTIANNFISGLIILTDRSIQVGDLVELEDGTMGTVKSLAIRATVIKTFDGKDIIVPNSEFISAKVQTWTYSDYWRRLTIPFGVSYDADPELVRQLALEAAREVPFTKEDKDHPIQVWFEGFGDNSLNFSIKVWYKITELNTVKTGLVSDYYFALFKRLKEANIEIPFPQRDLHIKSLPDKLIDFLGNKGQNKN